LRGWARGCCEARSGAWQSYDDGATALAFASAPLTRFTAGVFYAGALGNRDQENAVKGKIDIAF
jgi:hypothetical protein